MVVEIDVCCFAPAAVPFEDKPPLLVDADRVKSTQFAAQLLEMIAGGNPQVPVSSGVVDHLELAENPTFQVRRDIPRADVIHEKRTQPIVAEIDDHSRPRTELMYRSTGHYSRLRNAQMALL